MFRRLPRYNHFPYTTLFRSWSRRPSTGSSPPPSGRTSNTRSPSSIRRRIEDGDLVFEVRPLGGGDRKSTRLNSSHMSISYTVFYLKKKSNLLVLILLHIFVC